MITIMIVLEARRYGNKLYYNISKGEYTYFRKGHEIWTEKADPGLYDYVRKTPISLLDHAKLETFPVYVKYAESCQQNVKEK